MDLSEFKNIIRNNRDIVFFLEDGTKIPPHFHLTEVGKLDKTFVDCGGIIRKERNVIFQFWISNDVEHRVTSQKFLKIIDMSEKKIDISSLEIEVEYQSDSSIGKYGLIFSDNKLILTSKKTDCLAKGSCGIIKSECCL